ncbi:MAG TPA: phage shock protein operon transcriptional activator [Gammaproteobacteria bacterium]|jgi:psp operon transcriptional activator
MEPRRADTALIGESPAFLAMLEHVSQAAKLLKPVLVIGERGTGKELITARLHYLSERWEQQLVRVNCAALTETLLESELFGHEAGAFTGATKMHQGCFEQADGGTLVLDELGTIPLRMQEKILRVIEYGEFQRVGGSRTLNSDARIVGSTNENLPALAAQGRFRSDLLDRLAFDVIHVPPLRARPEDIEALAYHFAVNVTSELRRPFFAGFTESAMAELKAHPWPGNVRELKNTVERSIYREEDPDQPIDALFFDPFASPFAPSEGHPAAVTLASGSQAASPPPDSLPSVAATPNPKLELPIDFRETVGEFEQQLLEAALERAQFKQTAAAELLGLSYHQLRGLLKKYGLPK